VGGSTLRGPEVVLNVAEEQGKVAPGSVVHVPR
jgi:hypothetical protein